MRSFTKQLVVKTALDNKMITLGKVQQWIEKHDGMEGRFIWFDAQTTSNKSLPGFYLYDY